LVSKYQDLSENFIREFKDKLDWTNISYHQKISEDFIRKFTGRINWYHISSSQNLSEDFIREFQDKLYWTTLSINQILSEDFIREFKHKLNNEQQNKEEPKEKMKETTKLDLAKQSGNKIKDSIKQGIAVGAATEGANYVFDLISKQLGLSEEDLNNPVKKELLMGLSVAALHVGSTVFHDQIPGMDKVQTGCELVIQGKSKDNFSAMAKHLVPVLMSASQMMDPKMALERIMKDEQEASRLRVESQMILEIPPTEMEIEDELKENESLNMI